MTVLVAFASARGSTAEIAERIAVRLREQGIDAQAQPVTDVTSLAAHEAVVVGSAIHNGDWLPEAAAFLSRHLPALAARPTWLFSVSGVGEGSSVFPAWVARRMRAMAKLPRAVAAVSDRVRPSGYHAFAGVVQPGDFGLRGRVFVVAFGGRFGDHRNWREIDGWAVSIAVQLRSAAQRPA